MLMFNVNVYVSLTDFELIYLFSDHITVKERYDF